MTPAPLLTPPSRPNPAPAPTGPERRRAARQTLVAKATIRPDVPPNAVTSSLVSTGFVSNISMGGIAFHTRRPLAIGEKYRISLEIGPMKWASRLMVVSCNQHDKSGTFDVGAQFVGNDLLARGHHMAA